MKEIHMTPAANSYLITVPSSSLEELNQARDFIMRPYRERDEAIANFERVKKTLEIFLSETCYTQCGNEVELSPYTERAKVAYRDLYDEFRPEQDPA